MRTCELWTIVTDITLLKLHSLWRIITCTRDPRHLGSNAMTWDPYLKLKKSKRKCQNPIPNWSKSLSSAPLTHSFGSISMWPFTFTSLQQNKRKNKQKYENFQPPSSNLLLPPHSLSLSLSLPLSLWYFSSLPKLSFCLLPCLFPTKISLSWAVIL